MPLYRIMMKARSGYPAECWAECDKPEEIAPLIAEMRKAFGPDEPARVLHYEGFYNEIETVFLVDDPAGQFSAEEATAPHYEFDQQEHGATMPKLAHTAEGVCSQCGRKGSVARLQIVGQPKQLTPCAECLHDIAAGTEVVPISVLIAVDDRKWLVLGWNGRNKKVLIGGQES